MDSSDVMDDKDSGPEVQVNIPASVMSRIEELMGGTEQFDTEEFDAVAYINLVFPTEQSLSGVESAVARCEFRLAGVEHDIRRLVRAQAEQRGKGQQALKEAQACIAELALQVADINKKAERSESVVREITSEIKQLDCAKSNLTAAITTLNHFHMSVRGVDALATMTQQRQYKEIVHPLQAIMEVLQHFSCYRDIGELAALRQRVQAIRDQLAEQIRQDFREAFSGGSKASISPRSLGGACRVADVLDSGLKQELLDWFVELQLQEYQHLFSADQEHSWLGSVERRYSWLKRRLLTVDDALAAAFPRDWAASERIAKRFCEITNKELSSLMAARRSEIDVKLLLYAVQKTTHFEMLLHKRFVGTEIENTDSNETIATENNEESKNSRPLLKSPWLGVIGRCFEPYLSLYITSLDENLHELMEGFIQDAKTLAETPSTSGAGSVVSSCAELFLFYKRCLVQCADLSNNEPMLELSGVFAKYLRAYCRSVLMACLPSAAPPARLAQLLSNDVTSRYTKQEIAKITSVITTSEYCLETTVHLEQKLKEKIAPNLADKVGLGPEQDLFHKMISDCIQMLVQDLEIACEPALQTMTKISWLNFDNVGDQSSYVTQIIMHLKNTVPNLRDNLASSRKYFTQFCIRFANSFIPKFIQNIYKCKPISTVGSEQLLLDTHMLKTALLEMPSIGSEVKRQAPATYTKVVIKLMTKAEMILKLVMAPLESNLDGFVGQFVQLLPESTIPEFHKVLDMKGAKFSKSQMMSLDAIFKDKAKNINKESN